MAATLRSLSRSRSRSRSRSPEQGMVVTYGHVSESDLECKNCLRCMRVITDQMESLRTMAKVIEEQKKDFMELLEKYQSSLQN